MLAHYASCPLAGRRVDTLNIPVLPNSAAPPSPRWEVVIYSYGSTAARFSHCDLVRTDGYQVEGRLLSDLKLRDAAPDDFWGVNPPQSVSASVSNAPDPGQTMCYFNRLLYLGHQFVGRYAGISRFDVATSLAYAENKLTGLCTGLEMTPTEARLTFSDEAYELDSLYPSVILSKDTFASAVTDSAQRPSLDLGKALPVGFGHVSHQPLIYVREDLGADYYDYLLGRCPMETTAANSGTTLSVQRSEDGRTWVDVSASEYTVLESTYVTGGVTYNAIRFTTQQLGFDGVSYYQLRASYRGLAASAGAAAKRNPVSILDEILYHAQGNAGGVYSVASWYTFCSNRNLLCDGWVGIQQRTLREIIEELLEVMGARTRRQSNDGWWNLFFDRFELQPMAIASLGFNDGYWNNIVKVSDYYQVSLRDSAKDVALDYRYVEGQGFTYRQNRTVFTAGKNEQVTQNRFVWEHETADRVLCFRQRKLQWGRWRLNITINTEGRYLRVGDIVVVTIPQMNISGHWMVMQATYGLADNEIELHSWDPQSEIYVPGTLPT